ncbi:MFS transporter [Streptomyces sp. NPDC005876]|uniref:MFS transporter n=1 Tax=Streptomyces sp. NPDC005876 TaxID=3157076 RepID=UPI0033D7D90C
MRTLRRTASGGAADGTGTGHGTALAALLTATFIGGFDSSMMLLAAPTLQSALGASFAQTQMVVVGYTTAYAVALMTGGRLGDVLGRRRVFLWGAAGFTLASAVCALAATPALLIVARVVQGLTAALMLPQVLAIIRASLPPVVRRRAVGLYGATIGLAWVAGPVCGGALMAWSPFGLGWRALFLVNIPVGVLIVAAARRRVPESHGPRTRLDVPGAVLLGAALFLLLSVLGGSLALPPVRTAGALVVAGTLLAVFWARECRLQARSLSPIVPPDLLRRRRFGRGLAAVLAFYAGNQGFLALLAYYVQDGLERSPLVTSLLFSPLSAGFALASAVGGRVPAHVERRTALGGISLMAAGLVVFAAMVCWASVSLQLAVLPGALGMLGLGQGLVAGPLISLVLGSAPLADSGAASAVLLTVTQLAHACSVAVIGTVFGTVLGGDPGDGTHSLADHARAAASTTLVVLAVCALAGLLVHRLFSGGPDGAPAQGPPPDRAPGARGGGP